MNLEGFNDHGGYVFSADDILPHFSGVQPPETVESSRKREDYYGSVDEDVTDLVPDLKDRSDREYLHFTDTDAAGKDNGRSSQQSSQQGERSDMSIDSKIVAVRDSMRKEIYEALQRTRREVAEQLKVDQEEEARREESARESARKMLLSKERVALIQENKGKSFDLKEKGDTAYREHLLKMETEERSRMHEEKKRAAALRREKIATIQRERSERLEKAVVSKLKMAKSKLESKHEEVAIANSMKATQTSLKLMEVSRKAFEIEVNDTAEKKKAVEEKDKRFQATMKQLKEKNNLLLNRQSDELKQSLVMAEQRRLLIEEKKAGEQELTRIKQAKDAVVAASRASTKAERPIKLNKVYAEQLRLGSSTKTKSTGLLETPGPGTYFRDNLRGISCRGGYMASSRANYRTNENPGPGHYALEQKDGREGSGAVPFAGRGKSDVDWTILTASKLPGVGQYDLQKSSQLRGGAKILGKGKSELEKVILDAKRMPGPGDYELIADGKSRPNSINAYILGIDKGYRYKE